MAVETPDAVSFREFAGSEGGVDGYAQEQHVALCEVPEPFHRGAVHRTAEDHLDELLGLAAREGGDLQTRDELILPKRCQIAGHFVVTTDRR